MKSAASFARRGYALSAEHREGREMPHLVHLLFAEYAVSEASVHDPPVPR